MTITPRTGRTSRTTPATSGIDADLVEIAALRPRRAGFEAYGFVVGADGSATSGSASGALAAVGVTSARRNRGG